MLTLEEIDQIRVAWRDGYAPPKATGLRICAAARKWVENCELPPAGEAERECNIEAIRDDNGTSMPTFRFYRCHTHDVNYGGVDYGGKKLPLDACPYTPASPARTEGDLIERLRGWFNTNQHPDRANEIMQEAADALAAYEARLGEATSAWHGVMEQNDALRAEVEQMKRRLQLGVSVARAKGSE